VYNWADHQFDGGNDFHLAEMTAQEFVALLSTRFKVQGVFGQRLVTQYQGGLTLRDEIPYVPTQRKGAVLRRIVKAATAPALSRSGIARRALPLLRSDFVPRPLTDQPWKYIIAVCEKM
jgi:hypothetical protein